MFKMPKWMSEYYDDSLRLIGNEAQMKFVLELADKNVCEETGGPFAAAVFDKKDGKLISAGTNLVVSKNCSVAHAEIVAIVLAQEKLQTYELNNHVLVSSAQPCVMCGGALLWSGIKKLVYGAAKNDVEELVGFDEGPVHPDWSNEMKKRGIDIVPEVLRDEARLILKKYKTKGGILY